jgi:hypothetical protein
VRPGGILVHKLHVDPRPGALRKFDTVSRILCSSSCLVNGFCRKSVPHAKASWAPTTFDANPDMNRIGSSGLVSRMRLARRTPLMSGITTSVRTRSTGGVPLFQLTHAPGKYEVRANEVRTVGQNALGSES